MMFMSLRDAFRQISKKTAYLNYGRDMISKWCCKYFTNNDSIRVLDIGCGTGMDLQNIKNSLEGKEVELCGVEFNEQNIKKAREKGIRVFQMDIEKDVIPVEDGFFDIVIANQILEHTKEIFWVCSEASRVLKKGGVFIVSVPNLASLHNRLVLMLGHQPTFIDILGPHVRGFTKPGFKRFVETDGYFKVLEIGGSNFYPFPPAISKVLSRILPTYSVSIFFLIRRQEKAGAFIRVLDTRNYETPYFKGAKT
jgi:SAM-dependent methyltransferase